MFTVFKPDSWEVVVQAFTPSTEEGRYLSSRSTCLQSEVQDSHGYTEKPSLGWRGINRFPSRKKTRIQPWHLLIDFVKGFTKVTLKLLFQSPQMPVTHRRKAPGKWAKYTHEQLSLSHSHHINPIAVLSRLRWVILVELSTSYQLSKLHYHKRDRTWDDFSLMAVSTRNVLWKILILKLWMKNWESSHNLSLIPIWKPLQPLGWESGRL